MKRASTAGLYIREKYGAKWNGFYVQVPTPSGNGLERSKLFSIGKCGGKREALKQATRWRDRTYKRLWGRPISTRGRWVRKKPRRGKRVVGVFATQYFKTSTSRGKKYRYRIHLIVAQVGPSKGRWRREFSVRRYGLARATAMAEAARKKMVLEYLQ